MVSSDNHSCLSKQDTGFKHHEFEPPTKFSKKKRGGGGVTGSQFLEGGRWERRGDLFQGGVRAFT